VADPLETIREDSDEVDDEDEMGAPTGHEYVFDPLSDDELLDLFTVELSKTRSKASKEASATSLKELNKLWTFNLTRTKYLYEVLFFAFEKVKSRLVVRGALSAYVYYCFDHLLRLCIEPFVEHSTRGSKSVV
jgi:hypothetical protein